MFSISGNIEAFERALTAVEREQLPFATSLAINDTLADVKRSQERLLDLRLDRPTPFTKRGLVVKRSTKRRLAGAVLFKPVQSAYLEKLETGGTRRPKRQAIPVPVNQRRNKYGNMPKGSIKRLLAKPNVFSGTVNGVPGIWQRRGKKGRALKLLVAYESKVTYQRQLHFGRDAFAVARRQLLPNLRQAMARAVRSAK